MIKRFRNTFPNKVEALTLSLSFHVIIAVCLSQVDFGIENKSDYRIPITINFEFEKEKIVQYEKNANLNDYRHEDNSSISDNIISNASATSGRNYDTKGNTTKQYGKSFAASLHEMEGLISDFNFRMRQLESDSTGAFSPVAGLAPDTESLSKDLSSGLLEVTGFGRSKCTDKTGIVIPVFY